MKYIAVYLQVEFYKKPKFTYKSNEFTLILENITIAVTFYCDEKVVCI